MPYLNERRPLECLHWTADQLQFLHDPMVLVQVEHVARRTDTEALLEKRKGVTRP